MKPGTLEVWRVQGKGPRFIKFMKNGAVRYRKSDLDAWIAEHTRASTSQE
jgi:predicted DNA-binding transcriptional regulator AlpA